MEAESLRCGRFALVDLAAPLLGPWFHTYALPVFAVVSVLVALARVARLLRGSRPLPQRTAHPADARAPRSIFGLSFESRPPPLTG